MTTNKNSKNTELFEKLLVGFCQEADPMKEMLEWMVNQLMEIEVSTLKTQVDKGRHSEERKTHRNGYRVRRWDTRLGTIYLTIPKVRSGGYQPFFLVNRQRSESALMSVIQECWINGISTRKMMRVFKSFGIEDISAAQVSQVSKELDEEVSQFRASPLSKSYPVVWIDALYEKIRDDRKVASKAIMIAMAINSEGQKEILAIEPMDNESSDTWSLFFDKLKSRGLHHIGLLVSDAHAGIQSALKSAFVGTSWQRCKVHFMRNILARIPHKHKEMIGKQLSHIFNQTCFDHAKQIAKEVIAKFYTQFPDAMEILSDGLEDALQFFHFQELPFGRTSSTNHLERLNREIRRRSNVVGTFPSTHSFLRLIGSYLFEYQADWSTGKAYVKPDRLVLFNANLAAKIAA
jgi:transposase-like protein